MSVTTKGADTDFGTPGEGPRVLIVGDSWVHGLLLERKATFGKLVARRLGASAVLDVSGVSRTAKDAVDGYLEQMREFRPTLAIVNAGGTDSLVFPRPVFQKVIDRFAPPDWQGLTGLSPRARFSSKLRVRVRQRAEQKLKMVFKLLLVYLFGGQRRRPIQETEQALREIMAALSAMGTYIVTVGFAGTDPRLYPRSPSEFRRTNVILEQLAAETVRSIYVDTEHETQRWNHFFADRLHLSPEGHAQVATLILQRMALEGWPFLATDTASADHHNQEERTRSRVAQL